MSSEFWWADEITVKIISIHVCVWNVQCGSQAVGIWLPNVLCVWDFIVKCCGGDIKTSSWRSSLKCSCVRTSLSLTLPAGHSSVPASVVQLGCRDSLVALFWVPHPPLPLLFWPFGGIKGLLRMQDLPAQTGEVLGIGHWGHYWWWVIKVRSWLTLVSGPLSLIALLWFPFFFSVKWRDWTDGQDRQVV